MRAVNSLTRMPAKQEAARAPFARRPIIVLIRSQAAQPFAFAVQLETCALKLVVQSVPDDDIPFANARCGQPVGNQLNEFWMW